jgi:GT2 family glycosyltransferase
MHNGARWLAQTLARVGGAADGLGVETIAVDNASSDSSGRIAQASGASQILRNDRNQGFSRAVNQAAGASRGETLIVINQDLYLPPGSLRILHEFLTAEEAVVGGSLCSESGAKQPSCGPFPTLAATLWGLALPRARRKYYLKTPALEPAKAAARVDWVTGALMAFPRSVFEAVGGFDEGYFMYYEDVDFCMRARQKGFPVYFLPAAGADHLAPYAERKDAPEWLSKEVRLSQMRYFEKHRPRWETATIRGLNRAYFAAKGWDWPAVSKAAAA